MRLPHKTEARNPKGHDHVILRALDSHPKAVSCLFIGGGRDIISTNHETLLVICHVGVHVDFSSMMKIKKKKRKKKKTLRPLEESLSITIIRCDLAIATHARKMHKKSMWLSTGRFWKMTN